jgi:hypothetical protein
VHLASRWSMLAGRALASLVSERGVHLLEMGLALDGALSAIEGWCLWRGYRWGLWLVVVATAAPLPLKSWTSRGRLAPRGVSGAATTLRTYRPPTTASPTLPRGTRSSPPRPRRRAIAVPRARSEPHPADPCP